MWRVLDGEDNPPFLMLRTMMTSAMPEAEFQLPMARRRGMIPDMRMDESGQGPRRAVAKAYLIL
jgi:hypothetical protein